MNFNEAVNELTKFGVNQRTAYSACRKATIQPQSVSPFGHTVSRPRRVIVATGDFGYTVTPVW